MADLRGAMMSQHFSMCRAEGLVIRNNGCSYAIPTFPIGDSYHRFSRIIPPGLRISEAPEELYFHYFFGETINPDALVIASTGLRTPKGWDDRFESDFKGGKRVPRILLKGDRPYCDVFLPYSPGRMYVPAAGNFEDIFDLDTGIPFEITNDENKYHTIHFWYDPNIKEDTAIGFARRLCKDRQTRCTFMYADYPRNLASPSENHVRLVHEEKT